MQIGDLVRIDNLIGIVTLWSDDTVIAKCHDGIAHTSTPDRCELIAEASSIITQYEEAIIRYGKQESED